MWTKLLPLASIWCRKKPILGMRQLVGQMVESIRRLYDGKGTAKVLMTGFKDFDEMTCGLHGGDLVVVAAHPSMGKTAFAMNIVENIAIRKECPAACAVFCPEMTSECLVQRLLCTRAGVRYEVLCGGFLSKERLPSVMEVAKDMSDFPIWIDDTACLSVRDLLSKARRLKRLHDIRLIIIDSLPCLEVPGGPGRIRRDQEIARISQVLKSMAVELDVPVIAVVPLLHDSCSQWERPNLRELRKIGPMDRDADLIGFLVREECYTDFEDRERYEGEAELVIAKNSRGPTGMVPLRFQNAFRFEDRSSRSGM